MLEGRTILVTGANTGIGRSTALELARRGAHVVLACRSREKAEPVMDAIRREAGRDSADFLELDLGSLASVRAAAAEYLRRDLPLHVLVNNAGLAGSRGLTADGFEITFGVNHLGHFLLTGLLLERLRASAPARIVNVSSQAHYDAKAIDFEALRRPTSSITGLSEYAVSKLANVLFTQELARRLDPRRVTAYALHPGVIASDVWRQIPWPVRDIIKLFMKSTDEGARTSVHCASAAELASHSGRYYDDCREKPPSVHATAELARRLWEFSEAAIRQ